MRFILFVIISVSMYAGYASGDQTPIPSPNPGAETTSNLADNQQLPPPVPMECKNTFVPVSERDIAAIEKEDNANGPNKTSSNATATPDADLSKRKPIEHADTRIRSTRLIIFLKNSF
jgi:hypothetical protein